MANKNIQIQDVNGNNLYPVSLIKVTYAQLKSLRDKSNLMPGMQYRITDYQCTTTQADTRSAGNQFDIIVTADSTNKLNEAARAIQHKGDVHFSNCNLAAWKIWYCLDNDKNRFAWADETDGKGVIYRMIDEFNNDVPYDFKNIRFKDHNDTSIYYYTFSTKSNINIDCSIDITYKCYSNTIKEYIPTITQYTECRQRSLNHIIFYTGCYYNSFGPDCHNIILGFDCYGNSFGNDCYDITFDYSCCSNSFGNGCYDITFGYICSKNSFGDECSNITFGSFCINNSFGANCMHIYLTSSTYYNNNFGNKCNNIVFKRTDNSTTVIRNYNFANGLNDITVEGASGRSYETKVEIDSNGVLKTFCLADLIVPKNDNAYPYSSSFIGEI